MYECFISPHPHWCLLYSVKILVILVCVKWYLIVDWICISTVTSDIFHSCILFFFFFEKCYSNPLPILRLSFFKLSCKNYSYICNKTFIKYMTCEYLIPICGLFFHFLHGIFWIKIVFNLRKFNLSIFLLLCIIFKKPKVTKFYSNNFS